MQDTTSIKAKIVNLIASVRTLMRSEFCRRHSRLTHMLLALTLPIQYR